MTLQEFISLVVERLSVHYPVQEAKAIAVRLLKESIEGYKGYEHLVEPGRELKGFAAGTEEYLLKCAQRLATGEPLQYVLGYEWFCGHRFNVAPGVLIPRPETEELVREVVSSANGPDCEGNVRVLDICTGSGCIAWSVAAELGKRAQVYGCDISPEALAIACGQEIDADVKFFECDILAPQAEEVIGAECGVAKFDIVVSNPPYVCECEKELMQKNVLDFEPELALFVPDDDPLRFYRRIAQLSGRLLKPGGKLFFEINERFGRETVEMLEETGFVGCRVLQDIFGKERMVVACR
ncbi:MAG: peptide chain release factor N(5)-glutamine methyltransferase [Bacteroidales bacterium]|nr:peptide chain release factor N(5)-glutamine methyltransferase [Bacteroidales bacterium]